MPAAPDTPSKFQMPATWNNLKRDGEAKSPYTINLYKVHLNRITAQTGLETIEKMMKATRKVNAAIRALVAKKPTETVVQQSARARLYYSALFMVLPEEYIKKPNAFYRANKKWQDGKPEDFKKTEQDETDED